MKRIKINRATFDALVDKINASGYWQLNWSLACSTYAHDGPGYILEANTPHKYNLVAGPPCPDSIRLIDRACQALIHEAQMDNDIQLLVDLKTGTTTSPRHIVIQDVLIEEIDSSDKFVNPPRRKKALSPAHRRHPQ